MLVRQFEMHFRKSLQREHFHDFQNHNVSYLKLTTENLSDFF